MSNVLHSLWSNNSSTFDHPHIDTFLAILTEMLKMLICFIEENTIFNWTTSPEEGKLVESNAAKTRFEHFVEARSFWSCSA